MDSDNDVMSSAFDASKSSPARVYDALLGGKDNFGADRQVAADLAAKAPEAFAAIRANRAFLVRAVRYLAAEVGMKQFIDLGSGLPTSPNVHEVARGVHPDARVVYVDNDPVVAAHGRAFNATDKTAIVQADLRAPDVILDHPRLRDLIDFRESVAVLAVAVLHFLDDHDSVAVTARSRQAMAPGSYLVLSHGSHGTREDIEEVADTYRRTTADVWVRTPDAIGAYLADLDLVEPGLVPAHKWRPDPATEQVAAGGPRGVILAAVARVPETADE